MEREKGFESGTSPVFSRRYVLRDGAVPGSTEIWDVPAPDATAPDPDALPSAVPSFLEACARLAGEAAAQGNFARARQLIDKAAQVAGQQEPAFAARHAAEDE